jgi:apolipoprotein N-acyltransferase
MSFCTMKRTWLMLFGGIATGLLLFAVFPPLNWNVLAVLAPIPLLYAIARFCYDESSPGADPAAGPLPAQETGRARRLSGPVVFALQCALAGWMAGTLQWGLMCLWIRDTLAMYGGLTGPLSWLAIALFAAIKGLHLALFAALAGTLLRRPWGGLAVAALWTGVERTHGPLGFTWLLLGNAGIDMALPLRLAPLTGVYGLSFVFVAIACAGVFVLLRRPRKHLLFLLPLLALWLLPAVRLEKAPSTEAVSLQPALKDEGPVSQEENERTVRRLSFLTLQEAMNPQKPTPQLVLWPEAPAPFYYYDDPAFRDQMNTMAQLAATPVIFGGVARTPDGKPLNSAIYLTGEGRLAGRYDKRILVPFGEFVPPMFGWIKKISSEAGDFEPGSKVETFVSGEHSIGPFICYEAASPHLVREVAQAGADVFVNISNDAYFGRSAARAQHLLLARMRAVENHRWLLRSTNDGITVSIDPAGRVWDRFVDGKRAVGRLRFGWEKEQTPYTRGGDWFAWGCLIVGLATAGLERIRQRG